MAHITLTGTLLTPAGKTAYRDQIRFTHKSTTGETVRSSVDLLTIIASGFYYVELEYGLVLIEYKSANDSQFKNLGVATVNGTNPSTSIPELLNGLVPVSSAELIQFQAILADAVTAKNESVVARNEAEAFAASIDLINDLSQAYIFDTVAAMKASSIIFPVGKVIDLTERTEGGSGRSGSFDILAGDFSSELEIDSASGVYIGLADNPLGTEKVAKRRYSDKLNLQWFGAKPNDVNHDNYDAIRAVIIFNLEIKKQGIYVPAGVYSIKQNKAFGGLGVSNYGQNSGMYFYGDGAKASKFLLEPEGGTDTWFYYSGDSSEQYLSDLTFDNIGFYTTNPLLCNGFNIYSNGTDKKIKFVSCEIYSIGGILSTQGTGNADLNTFTDCLLTPSSYVLKLDNSQSVVHKFIGCNIFTRGDCFIIAAGGGGDVQVFGGSHIMFTSDENSPLEPHYYIRSDSSATLAQGNNNFTFKAIRFEIYNQKGLVKLDYQTAKSININFDDCGLGYINSAVPTVNIDGAAGCNVGITGGSLASTFSANVNADSGQLSSGLSSNSPAHLTIDSVSTNATGFISDNINLNGDFSRVTIKNISSNVGVSSRRESQDIDMGATTTEAPRGRAINQTTFFAKRPRANWPNSNTALDITFKIPTGAYIKRIYIYRPSVAVAGADYQLFVGSEDKTTVLGQSVLAPANQAHTIEIGNTGIVGFNTFKVWAETVITNQYTGYGEVIVEYI